MSDSALSLKIMKIQGGGAPPTALHEYAPEYKPFGKF